jgi:hypothetical protein
MRMSRRRRPRWIDQPKWEGALAKSAQDDMSFVPKTCSRLAACQCVASAVWAARFYTWRAPADRAVVDGPCILWWTAQLVSCTPADMALGNMDPARPQCERNRGSNPAQWRSMS